MGTVTIINQSYIESGNNIDVQLENQSLFDMQRKTLIGTHLEYTFSENFMLGGTIMHLSEKPMTTKISTGNEPMSNTIWGLNTSWRKESQWLTNMLDLLPFVNATQPSTIALNAEFAQLIPGHSKVIGEAGYAYIDDFETTKTNIDIHYPFYWSLASVPSKFPEAVKANNLDYGRNRALLAWYNVDPILNSESRNTPQHLRDNPDLQSNHFTRNVLVEEIFPNRDKSITETSRQSIMNLSFYPSERGPYNLNAGALLPDGRLSNPKGRWGGIMRKLDVTDFETSNIEYIEFWLMDPFINDTDGSFRGGELYFNLGDVSEDILKDGKKFFEHGMNADGSTENLDETVWGYVPKIQSTVRAFDNSSAGARKNQDVGLNGLRTEQEFNFPSYKAYLDSLEAHLSPTVVNQMKGDPFSPFNDPAGDNYQYYRGNYWDQQEATILTRYKYFNGTERNSADASENDEDMPTAISSLPDMEDINGDNTLNEYENYFEYLVHIKRDSMDVGKNHITEKAVRTVKLKNGKEEQVTWYQFKIPVREHSGKAGNINNFKSIRFIRMYMTGFEQEAHLRFATLDLVRGEWRKYTKPLTPNVLQSGTMDVLAVNVEENSNKEPVNYILPPGISRQTDPGQPQLLQQNEQSMVLKVNNLAPKEALAVYKKTFYDMRQYKRLQMFVHAEELVGNITGLQDNELAIFVRLGTDMVNNYYEYEIPLKITPHGIYYASSLADRETVWPHQNMFDFPFSKLTQAKLQRNRAKEGDSNINNLTVYVMPDPDNPSNSISVLGNPTLSEVNAIMIGIRNVGSSAKSGEIWVNELRMSEFEEDGGWGALANASVGLSDIGSLSFAGRMETAGFGGIESNVMDRRLDNLYQLSFATSLDLGRFLPEKAKLQIPAYFSYSNETLTPKYSPMDGDIILEDALDNLGENQAAKDSLIMLSQTVSTTKSFNISNAKVNIRSEEPRFYDPANITVTYVHNESNRRNAEIEENLVKDQRLALNYSHSFNVNTWEPFKNSAALDKPFLKIIKELNLNYMPSNISFNTDINRSYTQTRLRNFDTQYISDEPVRPENDPNLTFSKNFMWNRQFSIQYDLTKAMKFSLQTAMNANIDEGYLTPEIGKEYYESWRDTVWMSIKKLGRPYNYQQVFTASWNIPINKLPLLDFISGANATYNANYNWNKTAAIMNDDGIPQEIGNIATGTRAIQLDGQFNLETLYNKSAYLKRVNQKYAGNTGRRTATGQNRQQAAFEPKTYTTTISVKKGTPSTVSHRLGSDRIRFSAVDKDGKPVTISYKTQNANTIQLNPKADIDSVSITIISRDPNEAGNKTIDFVARTLMMIRRGSVNFRQSDNMTIPGFYPEAGFMGQRKTGNVYAPGFDFAFGLFNDNLIDRAIYHNWLNNDTTTINPIITAETSDFDARLSLEPLPGLKIDLNAQRSTASNTSVQYMFDGRPTTYTGSFNATQIAIATIFKKTGTANENFYSHVFETFKQNREIIRNRLNAHHAGKRYPNVGFLNNSTWANQNFDSSHGYDLNSSDVLIPAFLAAYTGRDPMQINTSPFLSLLQLLPNWRASYDGLSRIPWIRDNFKTVAITHAYTCRYTIGNYTSYSTWVPLGGDDSALGYIRDVQSDSPIPSMPYDISSVSLVEQFSPLIGINVALKNSVTSKLEYRKERSLVLNSTSLQLIETASDAITLGFGYIVNDLKVTIRSRSGQSNVKNDLKLNMDVSYKDMKSLLRKLDDDIVQASSGNKLLSIKLMGDYVFSSKVTIQLFFDHQTTTPLISTTFPVSTTNFGMSFKFMLTR
jgi:cell surface protein SprA